MKCQRTGENLREDKPLPRVICVQSAKGGVGKTLLSLLLARHLQGDADRCRAAVLDLDFTGTSVSDIRHKEGHAKILGVELKPLKNAAGKETNLLELFQGHLHGKDLAQLLEGDAAARNGLLHIPSGCTFGQDQNPLAANILFDANHSVWFVEFLFTLFRRLNSRWGGGSKPFYIVLDNAPGQSELLPPLQQRLLRWWGRDNAKFLHVASLDEMDIRASLTVLDGISRCAETILKTKQLVSDRQSDSVERWAGVLSGKLEKEVDRDLVLSMLGEGNEGIEELRSRYVQEAKAAGYMALVLNRVHATVDLGAVDRFILEWSADGADGKGTLAKVIRAPFPYDPGLALFFQEAFCASRGADGGGAPQAFGSLPSEAGTPGEPPGALNALAQLDLEVYRRLYTSKALQDAHASERALVRALPFEIASHLCRGMDAVCRLLDLAHRMVASASLESPLPRSQGDRFRLRLLERFNRLMGARERDPGWPSEKETLFNADFVNLLFSSKEHNEKHVEIAPDVRKKLAAIISEPSSSSTILQELLRELFPLFGLFVANLDSTKASGGIFAKDRLDAFGEVFRLAQQLSQSAEAGQSAEFLIASLLPQYGTSSAASGAERIEAFHLELAETLERLHLFHRSTKKGALVSALLLRLVKQLPREGEPLAGVASLYLHTALAGLFSGLRDDPEQVYAEALNLLAQGRGAASPDLARRIGLHLGRIVEELFRDGDGHADH